jgi:ferredoxin-thioredoxin reductase catalytic subunit
MLDDLAVDYQCIEADILEEAEREQAIKELKKINPNCTFPTLIINDQVIVGFKAQAIKEKLGLHTEIDDLYERLQKVNEPKGYFFNSDKEKTFELLRGLLTNRDRYGYMACPCRLASGKRDQDQDIICPCTYREPDVREFGSCYCGLYASEDWNANRITRQLVPERRPVDRY